MSENLKKVLHTKGLEITFFVDEGMARVEYRSNNESDLAEPDDIVLFVNGDAVSVESITSTHASASLGEWSRYSGQPVKLMTRVGEFFDGWEFDP